MSKVLTLSRSKGSKELVPSCNGTLLFSPAWYCAHDFLSSDDTSRCSHLYSSCFTLFRSGSSCKSSKLNIQRVGGGGGGGRSLQKSKIPFLAPYTQNANQQNQLNQVFYQVVHHLEILITSYLSHDNAIGQGWQWHFYLNCLLLRQQHLWEEKYCNKHNFHEGSRKYNRSNSCRSNPLSALFKVSVMKAITSYAASFT